MSGTDDEELFTQISTVDDFFAGIHCETETITPTREEIGKILHNLYANRKNLQIYSVKTCA